ncbi:MAG: TIR domain-containing protein [Opitutus sp.]|nr:TIR domain-containing protein [Opitutus sp.]
MLPLDSRMDLPTAHAVFISYASQDAAAALRLCAALRAAGIVVWLDQSELVGDDAWDRKIRGQIASCTLFLPVISVATPARREGDFRLDWILAALAHSRHGRWHAVRASRRDRCHARRRRTCP